MHLLQMSGANSFSLVERFDDEITKYAILSHTWGQSDDEVTYQYLHSNIAKGKKRYSKLMFCGKQARMDGLHILLGRHLLYQ